jgi:endogenous inhibitor of DNA gyrase (YacG/DUF329 family)
MTDTQRTAIADYRRNGYGYKKISQLTGVCESSVKTYCRRNGLTGTAAETPGGVTEKPCLCCGKPVIQYPGRKEKKFCSDSCRNKWWNSHLHLVNRKAMYDFVCPTCGKPFSAYGNRNRKYCSHECYIEDRFGGAVCG